MELSLLTPLKKLLEGEQIEELFAPGVMGQLDILPLHANIVTQLETGVLRWKTQGAWKTATVSYGLLEIAEGKISVLADIAELGDKIDLARAKTAEAKARQKVEEGGLDDANFRKYELKLQRAMARVSASAGN